MIPGFSSDFVFPVYKNVTILAIFVYKNVTTLDTCIAKPTTTLDTELVYTD